MFKYNYSFLHLFCIYRSFLSPRYCTHDLTSSGFDLWAEDREITALDLSYLFLFIISRGCDVLLIIAALKQKSDWDKTPLCVVPWLVVNALELCLKVVSSILV